MNQLELIYEPYELKFSQPFKTSRGNVTHRRGFIIILKNARNIYGRGDICPFPEFGSETYEEAEKYLKNLRQELSLDLDDAERSFESHFSDLKESPSVRCGIEQALFTLITNEKNISLNHLFNRKSRGIIKVNGLIGIYEPLKCAGLAEQMVQEGFTTLKVKVGRDSFSDDLECIRKINSVIPENIKLRLDVNGKWNAGEASDNLKQLEKFNIEYVEQPVNNKNEFCELVKTTTIPLAADESVRNIEDAYEFIKSGAVKYLVLKPMMLGGIIPLMRIYDEAKKNNIGVVVSSSFESGIGRGYAVFAASLVEDDTAHGFATQHYFEYKFLPETFTVKNGVIRL
jgi:o-succinylbenzoate synthase